MPDQSPAAFFELFNEIGIIEQLSRARLEARLPHGLIAPHFTVLNHLVRVGDGRTPIALARAFQVPKTSMTHTLKGLDAHGYVALRPNPEDGRSKCVWITDTGRALRAEVIATLEQDFGRMATGLDMPRLLTVTPVLRALRVFLDENREVAPERLPR